MSVNDRFTNTIMRVNNRFINTPTLLAEGELPLLYWKRVNDRFTITKMRVTDQFINTRG
jgi:hypothetical protein